jgi:hypothetical protein
MGTKLSECSLLYGSCSHSPKKYVPAEHFTKIARGKGGGIINIPKRKADLIKEGVVALSLKCNTTKKEMQIILESPQVDTLCHLEHGTSCNFGVEGMAKRPEGLLRRFEDDDSNHNHWFRVFSFSALASM